MGIVIRTRTAGLVAAMMPCRLCCRVAPQGAPANGTRAGRATHAMRAMRAMRA